MASWRSNQFAEPSPDGWTPEIGEEVLLRRKRGSMGNIVAYGRVVGRTMLPDMVIVRIEYGSKRFLQQWMIDDLRPLPKSE